MKNHNEVIKEVVSDNVKTYEETLELVREYVLGLNFLIRNKQINEGFFCLLGHFIGSIYGVDDDKIIEDFVVEENGFKYKLINLEEV